MRHIRVMAAGLGTALTIGILAPAAFADGGHGGDNGGTIVQNSGSSGGSQSRGGSDDSRATTTASGTVNVNSDNDEPPGDGGHNPALTANTGVAAANKGTGDRDDHGRLDREHIEGAVLRATLAPSSPADPAIFGVTPGGVAWSISNGNVRLNANGSLRVNVEGLVVTSTNANPLPDIAASLYCNGTLAGTSQPARFSARGNAEIQASLSLPSGCMVPAVLLHPATGPLAADVVLSTYIAFDGV